MLEEASDRDKVETWSVEIVYGKGPIDRKVIGGAPRRNGVEKNCGSPDLLRDRGEHLGMVPNMVLSK